MPFEAYKLYQEYEPDKYKTSTQKKAEGVLKEAETIRRERGEETRVETVEFEEAKELFGEDLIGPEEIEKTWGFRPDEVPEVPFSREELERAKEMGQMLVLRVEKTEDGKPMSLGAMNAILAKRWEKEKKGGFLNTAEGWRDRVTGSKDFAEVAPRHGWALVSKDLLPDSTSKNYIEQTEVIIKALREKAFKDIEMPEEYEDAIQEFEANKARLTKLMSENLQQAAKELSELKINQLSRQSIQETIYDLAMYYDTTGKRLLPNVYTWSSARSADGDLVRLGGFASEGVGGRRLDPGDRNGYLGVSLSRTR